MEAVLGMVNQPGLKSDHLCLSSAEIKNEWSYISITPNALVARKL
jgi:hypothetical protein